MDSKKAKEAQVRPPETSEARKRRVEAARRAREIRIHIANYGRNAAVEEI